MIPNSLAALSQLTEEEAREMLERIRWPNGAACPHCGDMNVTKLQGKSTRPGTYKCRGCRKPFTVTVKTIFHRSHISLRQWLMAFHLVCSSKKGISALQLQRNLGLGSYKSAWHMAHRIRHAMRSEPLSSMLQGTVEVDETYIGGKPRNRGSKKGRRPGFDKPSVVALVERDGQARTLAMERVNLTGIAKAIRENVDMRGRLMTDEALIYKKIGQEFEGGHHTTNHASREYARGDVYSNTAESFFALLKRGIHGTFHHVSKRHLGRYADEFEFRWNHRKVKDGERTTAALKATDGKRLVYGGLQQTQIKPG